MDAIIAWLKAAIAALLKILGVETDEEFADNVESGVKDVIDYGNSLVD